MRTWLVGVLSVTVWIVLAPSALAQNAQITGVVKDSSGAIIPGATVTARNIDTGLTRIAVTDGSGEYRLPSLPPGRYGHPRDDRGRQRRHRRRARPPRRAPRPRRP